MAKHASGEESHTVWNLPGINKTEFYAACIYLSAAQKQQGKTRLMPGPQGELKASQLTRDFLDHLADCFARSKGDDKPQHVTATAMVKSFGLKEIDGLEEIVGLKEIVIAKNRAEKYSAPGPQGRKDKDFAEFLQDWFNQLSRENSYTADDTSQDEADSIREDAGSTSSEPLRKSTSSETLSAQGTASSIQATTGLNPPEDDRHRNVWEKMLDFNDSRVKSCIKMAKKTKKMESAIEEASKRLPGGFEEHKFGFEKAWAVVDLCNNVTDLKSLESKSHCIKEAEACRQDPGFSRIRRIVRKEREHDVQQKKDYKDLSELIKFIDLLGRLRYAFKTFQKYCGSPEAKGSHFTLQFLDSSEYSRPQGCSSRIEEWYELNPEHRDALPQKVRDNAIEKANPDKRPLLFHCELQLLKYFIDNPSKDCQDYFGCSKRSCWLCWSILTYVNKFHTKDSHLKIYDSWAFPVRFSPEKEKLRLSTALALTYRDLIRQIRQKIFAGTGFAEYEVRTETSGRAPEMASVVNTPHSGIRRIALPETDRPAVTEVSFVCFPANGRPQCEQVMVGLYDMNHDDLFECMQQLVPMSVLGHRNELLIPAFMLVNKPSNEDSFADQSWVSEIFLSAYDGDYGKRDLRLYFQSNPDEMRNPWISDKIAELNTVPDCNWEEIIDQEDFVWRGSIFAVMVDEKKRSVLPEDLPFVAEVETFLANEFKKMTPEEYVRILERLADRRREVEERNDRFRGTQKLKSRFLSRNK